MTTPPLAGIRVVEFAGYIAGPGVGLILAELGADVVKVEPLSGDAARHMGPYGDAIWRNNNRGKRSVALDLAHERGREIAVDLIAASDVVVQNLRPGAMERLGLGPDEVRERFPRLIYLSVTGFSSRGPNATRLGFDVAAQAESGMMSITGEGGGDPLRIGYPVVDTAAGHFGAEAVMAALIGRNRTGAGTTIEVPMYDVAVHLQNVPLSTYLDLGREPVRTGNGQPYNAPSADVVNTRDGQIVISAYPDAHWRRLCGVIGRSELADDPRFCSNEARVANRPAMLEALSAALSSFDSESASALLRANNIVAGIVRGYRNLEASEEFRSGNFVVRAREADGTVVPAIRLPYRIESAPDPSEVLPALGGDAYEVLSSLGRSADEISELQRRTDVPGE